MSLAIDVSRIEGVLLADGWHDVEPGSFDLDAYEYVDEDVTVLRGGAEKGVPALGAEWREPDGGIVACPVTAVLAVKWSASPTD